MWNKKVALILSSFPRSREYNNIKYGSPHPRGLRTSGFTLVEVLISAVILSIVVFWILRLSGNNASQIGVLEKNRLMNETISSTRECLKSINYDTINALTSTASVNFGADNNWCQIWAYSADLSFSWIVFKSYDDKGETWWDEIWSYIKVNTWTAVMNIENYVSDWTNTKKSAYKIYR
jgi:prepilin-type N-terminal cleavage/methylation domain-containing protein